MAFPTETVYGLGGDALNPESSRKIYAAKGRPSDNPLIVHICRWEDLSHIVKGMPDDKTALALIRAAGGFIAAPSANVSGRPSPTLAKYVQEDLGGRIEMILDGGQACIGLESTIVDLTEETPTILRPGYITKEMLSEILGEVEIDRGILSAGSDIAPKAPGAGRKRRRWTSFIPKRLRRAVSGRRL